MAAVWQFAAAASMFKLLFIPAYRSTDFEVHRNWLAITHSLPMRQWYTEDTSIWTLDYPPLFAWFEYLMSQVAKVFDPRMLEVTSLNYASDLTVVFQRLSVVVADFVFFYAASEFYEKRHLFARPSAKSSEFCSFLPGIVPALLICNFGLFIVDHIHFQYNGILFGLFLLSIIRIIEGRELEGALWFSVLLNMKHIFMYVAPAYFIYLLRSFCFEESGYGRSKASRFSIRNFISLGAVVISVFSLSFGPFIYFGQIGQVMSRLFPFKRGLVHAYWAPNFWAAYSFADKMLTVIGLKQQWLDESSLPTASMTGGKVQEYSFIVLPDVPPVATLALTVIFMMPGLCFLWVSRDKVYFVNSVILCAFTSFLFGWHVHEKAVLLIILPLTLLIHYDKQLAKIYLLLSITGHYSLFPLLFTPFENVLKVLLFISSVLFTFMLLQFVYLPKSKSDELIPRLPFFNFIESLYMVGLLCLGVFNSAGVHVLGVSDSLPFLPLLLTSVYCSVGVVYSFLQFYVYMFTSLQTGDDSRQLRRKAS